MTGEEIAGNRVRLGRRPLPNRPRGAAPAVNPVARAKGRRTGYSPVLLFVLVLIVPVQFSLDIGGVVLSPVRAFLIVIFFPALLAFLKAGERLHAFDYCMLGYSLWTAVGMFSNNGIGAGIQASGQFFLETTGLYLMVQAYVRHPSQIRATVRLLFGIVVILGLLGIPEALSHRPYLMQFASLVTGRGEFESPAEGRLGLMRVTSVFLHPILYGLFCASILSLVWYLERDPLLRMIKGALIACATFLSLSSAPILVFMLQLLLILTDRITRRMRLRMVKIGAAVLAMVAALNVTTRIGAFGVLAYYLTFNPHNAFYRALIWEHGIDDVLANPILGINPENWTRLPWMGTSIDNYWIFQAMQGGIPSVVLIALCIFTIWRRLYRRPDRAVPPVVARLRKGWSFAILSLVICGATVAFFGKLQPYFTLVIALGAALARIEARCERSLRAS